MTHSILHKETLVFQETYQIQIKVRKDGFIVIAQAREDNDIEFVELSIEQARWLLSHLPNLIKKAEGK